MKPTKEIIEKAARRGALLQNVQLIMWEFVKKRESDESVNWIEYAGKIVDVVLEKELAQAKADGAREVIEKIRPFDLVEDCEPDCTPVRHALHEGSWKAHLKLERILATLREDYQLKEEV